MSSWLFKKCDHLIQHQIDVDKISIFIKNSPSLYYMVRSISAPNIVSAHVKARSVLRAIKAGHLDVEIWVKANPLVKTVKWCELTRKNEFIYEPTGQTQTWVLDLDHMSPVQSIDELRTLFIARNVPLPTIIVQTGPNSFHCVYRGDVPGAWPDDKRWWIVEKFSCWTGQSLESRDVAAMAAGVDLGYFRHPWHNHQFRIPGSLNAKYIIDGKMWICRGWRNFEYFDPHVQYLKERNKENLIISIKTVTNDACDFEKYEIMYTAPITNMLKRVYPGGLESIRIEMLAKMMAKSSRWLINNKCRIHQITWAEQLGVSQATMSRILKRLIYDDILIKISDSYIRGQRSKIYGAGPRLRPLIGMKKSSMEEPTWTRWDDGTSWERMLYDIKYFVSLGWSDNEIVEKLVERESHRPVSKRRGAKQFTKSLTKYRQWLRKCVVSSKSVCLDVLDGDAS